MTLNPDRVREVLWLLRKIINVDPKYKYKDVIPLADLMPSLERDLARAIIDSDEKSEAALIWLANAVYYCTGDSDELPKIDIEWKIN